MCEMEHTNQQCEVTLPGMNKGKPQSFGKHKSSIIIRDAVMVIRKGDALQSVRIPKGLQALCKPQKKI